MLYMLHQCTCLTPPFGGIFFNKTPQTAEYQQLNQVYKIVALRFNTPIWVCRNLTHPHLGGIMKV